MPNTRHHVATDVATAFLPAKIKAKDAAVASLEALAVMLEARTLARMPDPNFGAEILEKARQGVNAAFDAQAQFHEVHALLAPIRQEWKIPPNAFGPNDTPAQFTEASTPISVSA